MRFRQLQVFICITITSTLLMGCAKRPAEMVSKPGNAAKPSIRNAITSNSSANNNIDYTVTSSINPDKRFTHPKGVLSLEAAIQMATDWHPAINETIGRLRQQVAVLKEADAGYLPSVTWGMDSTHKNTGADIYNPNFSLNVSQMLYDFGKVDSRVNVATAGISGRRSQVLETVDDLARETANTMIDIQRNRALNLIAVDQIKDTKSILELVKLRTEKGASTQSDFLQAEARVQAAEATQTEISGQLSRLAAIFSSLIGQPGRVEVARDLPSWLSKACSSDKLNWAKIPAVMKADADQQAANAQIDLSTAEGLPTLSLDAGVGVDTGNINLDNVDYAIGVKVSGSLYNGGATSARRMMAEQSLYSSSAAKEKIRVETMRNLAEARSQISSKENLRSSLMARQKTMRLTRDLYQKQYIELGTRTLLDLLNADQELHAARFDTVNIEHDLHKLNIDCTYSSGQMRDAFNLNGRVVHGTTL